MIWLAMVTHASQMNTLGPATSFATSVSLLPQNEQASRRLNMTITSLADYTVINRSRC